MSEKRAAKSKKRAIHKEEKEDSKEEGGKVSQTRQEREAK